jgi:sec-independent protein translocase protein TatA
MLEHSRFLIPLAIGMPMGMDLLVIAAIALLLFGKRLPEVGRSLGKGIVEFKKGLKGIEDDVTQVDQDIDRKPAPPAQQLPPQQTSQTTVQQYDPYTGKPITPRVPEDEHVTHG